jgi:hypothetical protein
MIEKLKPLVPYLAAVAFFVFITLVYFSPVLQKRSLPQMDNTHAIGMAKELVDHEKETGEKAQWTNSMFGGMPAYQIKADSSANIFSHLNRAIRLGLPYHTVAIVFLYLLGFFILMRSMGFNHWMSVIGSVAFAFGSYNFIIIIAGHITKAYAIALMAPVIGGVLFTYNKNKWGGALFTAVALGAEIAYNHVQITYYLAILILILALDKLSRAIANNTIPDFFHRSVILVAAAVIAVLPNITNLWTTYEYGKESIRGKSELLEEETTQKASGLDPDYAFAWSYGRAETLTFLIPNFMGGASEPIGNNTSISDGTEQRIRDLMSSSGVNYGPQQNEFVRQLTNEVLQQSQYWGSKPFTSGPVYAGSIICFLFVLALFFYKGREKWWLLAGTILSILLAWGNNLEWFNMMFFDYFPLYNKFRTVEMALVVASFTIPVLALLGLKHVMENPDDLRTKSNLFLLALGLTGGVALLFYLVPGILNYMSPRELQALTEQKMANPDQAIIYDILIQEMQYARMALMRSDALRSLIFISLASGSLWFFAGGKLSPKYVIPGILILILIDLWGVDKRYLNNEHFVPARQMRQLFVATEADKLIQQDSDLNFRVFTVNRNPFTEVNTSYFHKSIGGYHGAKLQRYQDVIDRYLQYDLQFIRQALQQVNTNEDPSDIFLRTPVLNMLNTKYVIYHGDAPPMQNPYAMGNAWLVNDIRTVGTYREELDALEQIVLSQTAIIHTEFADVLQGYTVGTNGGTIELTEYGLETLNYRAEIESPQLAVFSEIYYTGGWNAYINGQKAPIVRVNYLLRGVFLPAGESEIVFRFEPTSYKYGRLLAFAGSIMLILLIGFYFWQKQKRAKMKDELTSI